MFEVKHIKGNTYYYEAFTNVGIYHIGNNKVVLIDSCDHPRMVKGLDKYLSQKELSVDTIISTHAHADHICGNGFFQKKYGCKILSTEKEKIFIEHPTLDADSYYTGIETDKSQNFLYLAEPSRAEVITPDNIPEGLSIFSLPGHSYDMIGVETDDGVAFLADCILSKKTWDFHKFPFFNNVNESIKTLEEIKSLNKELYLPSHDVLSGSIRELADYNLEKLREKKELVFSLCDGHTFDEIFALTIEKSELKLTTDKYASYALMIKKYLQALIDDKRIGNKLIENRFIYYKK